DIPAPVKRMEKITGYSFYRTAAVHTGTDHPRARLPVNGKDRDGREARFDKLFITQTRREMVLTISLVSVILNPRKDRKLYWPAALKNALLLIWREGTS
ncbi:MAG: hypothetical protein LBP80_05205, partial [Treponema sp.]|nr:hypothetical protein [Treponema sp.]